MLWKTCMQLVIPGRRLPSFLVQWAQLTTLTGLESGDDDGGEEGATSTRSENIWWTTDLMRCLNAAFENPPSFVRPRGYL
ncbi:hypothetical protein EDB81DRAFT_792218, partial [Dactylonectria macrodidyma]